jgi:hypothetical protein
MRSLVRALSALIIAATLAVVGGCKQGVGERCQIDSDCTSNICLSSGVCDDDTTTPTADAKVNPDSSTIDAAPVDAEPIDAVPVDAVPIDAMPIDAMPQPDAA